MNLDVISANSIILVPLIIAVVSGFKLLAPNLSKWAPLVAIIVGIIFSWLFYTGDDNVDMMKSIITSGIIGGLSASGLYSGISSMKKNSDPEYVDTERVE